MTRLRMIVDEVTWEPQHAPIEVRILAWLNEVRPEGRRKVEPEPPAEETLVEVLCHGSLRA